MQMEIGERVRKFGREVREGHFAGLNSAGKSQKERFRTGSSEEEIWKGKFGRGNSEGRVRKWKFAIGSSEGEVRKGKF